jgi:hypothetical protein
VGDVEDKLMDLCLSLYLPLQGCLFQTPKYIVKSVTNTTYGKKVLTLHTCRLVVCVLTVRIS